MSEPVPSTISIGGAISADKVPGLIAAIKRQQVSIDWGDGFVPETPLGLRHIAGEHSSGVLQLTGDANYGRFAHIEEFCVTNGISFDLCADPKGEQGGFIRAFRPGVCDIERDADSCGCETVRREALVEVRHHLSECNTALRGVLVAGRLLLAEASGRLIAALQKLEEVMGPDIPILEPFLIALRN